MTGRAQRSKRISLYLLLVYAAVIVYGTLFPFSGWRVPIDTFWLYKTSVFLHYSKSDMLANVLLYMPFGFLFTLRRRPRAIPLALLCALLLSASVETTQMWLPSRVASLLDTTLNVAGTACGVVVAYMLRGWSATLGANVSKRLRADPAAHLGLAALVAWFGARWVPYVPTLDMGDLRRALKPLWYFLHGSHPIVSWHCASYVLATFVLTVVGAQALRITRWGGVAAVIVLAVLPGKVGIQGQTLTPDAFFGTLAGVAAGLVVLLLPARWAISIALLAVPCYMLVAGLHPAGADAVTHPFSWIPLHAQFSQPINGAGSLLDSIWPVAAAAFLCRRLGVTVLWFALPAVVALLVGVEWGQAHIPGRYPDITTILAGTLVWLFALAHVGRLQHV